MPSDTGRGRGRIKTADIIDGASFEADKNSIIDNPDELEPERRDKYLKRLKKEDQAAKKYFAKVDEWLVIEGKKVLRKVKNKAGSEYTFYWFNTKRELEKFRELTREGKLDYGSFEDGLRTLELRTVDGRPFKPKAS